MATKKEVQYWISCLPKVDDKTLVEALRNCNTTIKDFQDYKRAILKEQERRQK